MEGSFIFLVGGGNAIGRGMGMATFSPYNIPCYSNLGFSPFLNPPLGGMENLGYLFYIFRLFSRKPKPSILQAFKWAI